MVVKIKSLRQTIIMICSAFFICLLLSSCEKSPSTAVVSTDDPPVISTEEDTSQVDIGSMANTTAFADLSDFSQKGDLRLLQVDAYIDGYASDEGYYRMVPRADGSNNLCYIDFATKQEIYLCSQPNCTHDNNTCTAWFPTVTGLHLPIPVGDRVILIHGGASGYEEVLGDDSLPHIDIMQPDGSDRKTIFTFPASSSIAPLVMDSLACDDEYVYFCVENYSAEATTRTLCAVSSQTGEVFSLMDLPEVEQKIAGVDGTALLFSYVADQYDLSQNIADVDVSVMRYDVSDGSQTPLFSHKYTDVGTCGTDAYWLLSSDSVLHGYDLKTGETRFEAPVSLPDELDLTQLHCDGLFDGKLLVHGYYSPEINEAGTLLYYAINTEDGTVSQLSHEFVDAWGNHSPGVIAAQIDDNFMFIYGADAKTIQFPFADGSTTDMEYNVYQYAFMKCSDYWGNQSDYTPIAKLPE